MHHIYLGLEKDMYISKWSILFFFLLIKFIIKKRGKDGWPRCNVGMTIVFFFYLKNKKTSCPVGQNTLDCKSALL